VEEEEVYIWYQKTLGYYKKDHFKKYL
jgi:hypothetical protein